MLALPGKLLRLTEGGVGCPGVPAYIGLLLKAPADRPLQYIKIRSRGGTYRFVKSGQAAAGQMPEQAGTV